MPDQTDRRSMKRITKPVLRRNQRLREAVEYIASQPSVCATELGAALNYSASGGRNTLNVLRKAGLVEYAGNQKTGNGRQGSEFYRICEGAVELSKELFVVDDNPEPVVAPRPNILPPGIHIMGDDQQWNPRRYKVDVRRDPLVAAICGYGRAPSLNFMDSNGDLPCPSP